MPQPVVGLIGCGHIGQFHSRNLRGSLRSELVPGEYVAVVNKRVVDASDDDVELRVNAARIANVPVERVVIIYRGF